MGVVWVKKFVGGDLHDPLKVGAQTEEKLQQVACYRAWGYQREMGYGGEKGAVNICN